MRIETESRRLLALEPPALNPGDAFYEISQQINDLITRRAHELFELRGSVDGHDREDWMQAVSETLLNAPIEVTETEHGLTVRTDVPGFGENDLEVRVAPRSVCVTGTRLGVREQPGERTIYSERRSNLIFRTIELPHEVDPERVNAMVNNGVLEIQLAKVGLGKKIPVMAKAAFA